MVETSALGQLITAETKYQNSNLAKIGTTIGKLYTDHGFPIDMALERFGLDKEQKLVVLSSACNWLIEHRRNPAAGEKAIERQRKANLAMIERFIRTGESGAY